MACEAAPLAAIPLARRPSSDNARSPRAAPHPRRGPRRSARCACARAMTQPPSPFGSPAVAPVSSAPRASRPTMDASPVFALNEADNSPDDAWCAPGRSAARRSAAHVISAGCETCPLARAARAARSRPASPPQAVLRRRGDVGRPPAAAVGRLRRRHASEAPQRQRPKRGGLAGEQHNAAGGPRAAPAYALYCDAHADAARRARACAERQ